MLKTQENSSIAADKIPVAILEKNDQQRLACGAGLAIEPRFNWQTTLDSLRSASGWMSQAPREVGDYHFPEDCGIAIFHECAKHHPSCEILVISEASHESTVFNCRETGASGYFLRCKRENNIVRAVLDLHGNTGGDGRTPAPSERAPPAARSKHLPRTPLTKREISVLELLDQGKSDKIIGQTLAISHLTVQTHLKNIYRKLQVNSRTEALFEARWQGHI